MEYTENGNCCSRKVGFYGHLNELHGSSALSIAAMPIVPGHIRTHNLHKSRLLEIANETSRLSLNRLDDQVLHNIPIFLPQSRPWCSWRNYVYREECFGSNDFQKSERNRASNTAKTIEIKSVRWSIAVLLGHACFLVQVWSSVLRGRIK